MLACSVTVDLGSWPLGTSTQQLPLQDKVSTAVAQTVQAFTQQALSATPANTPLPTATATPTNTPMPAALSVSVATNCYAGPRTNYGFVITIRPGTTVTVVGKDTADNYWIIDVPGYPGTVCWLSGQYASVTGDTASLPSPATPVASIYTLSEPKNLRVSCTSESDSDGSWWHSDSELTVVFRWTNTEPHQAGVRVYRNGYRVATLGGHASSYTDTTSFHGRHHDLTYGVQAYTGTAVSSIVSIDVGRCR
jgi:hypothetical protein